MKNILATLVLSLSCNLSFGQVIWEKNLDVALAKAKSENKLLFVELFLPTCPACQAVEPNFANTDVSTAYNSKFVNYKMDGSVPGGKAFLDKKGISIPSFPQFLFFDGDGNLVHQSEVNPNPQSLISVAAEAENPATRSSNYETVYQQGNRDINFLIKYAVNAYITGQSDKNKELADLIFQMYPKEELSTKTSWLIMQKVVNDTDNGFFQYWIENMPTAIQYEKETGHGGDGLSSFTRIIQSTIFNKDAKTKYSVEKVKNLRKYMGLIRASQFADISLWELEVLSYLRANNLEQALNIGNNISNLVKENGPMLIYVTKVFNDNFPSKIYLESAAKWLSIAKPLLKENAYLAEYNYELARLQQKENKAAEAKINAQKALELAKLAKSDLTKFNELLSYL